jgi:Na+/melibiose symporter-like transporter
LNQLRTEGDSHMRFLYGVGMTFAAYLVTILLSAIAHDLFASVAQSQNPIFGLAGIAIVYSIIVASLVMFVCSVLCWIGFELVAIRKTLEAHRKPSDATP